MVKDVAFAEIIKRRQRILVDGDAQIVVSYLVISKPFAAAVNAQQYQSAISCANNHAPYTRR